MRKGNDQYDQQRQRQNQVRIYCSIKGTDRLSRWIFIRYKRNRLAQLLLKGYEEHRGDFPSRYSGSLVSDRQGKAVAYALFHLEPRGRLFVVPGDDVYEGMVVGEYNKWVIWMSIPVKRKTYQSEGFWKRWKYYFKTCPSSYTWAGDQFHCRRWVCRDHTKIYQNTKGDSFCYRQA